MIELPFLFTAGLLGSSHCLGMCGGFALAIGGGASGWRANLARQSTYTLGRVFSYASLGAAAGYGGWRLTRWAPLGVDVAAWLAIGAGALLVYQGLVAAGVWKRKAVVGRTTGCPGPSMFGVLLTLPGPWRPFLAGVFTGLLPCGLLYGMLALAASTHHWASGMAAMAVFGAGTAPAMIVAGWGGALLSLAARRRLWSLAAWCLVVAGTVSMARGAFVLASPSDSTARICPVCPPAAPQR